VVHVSHRMLSWAVTEVVRVLTMEGASRLKVPSGEHLAAIVTTAFLGTAPISIDLAGEPDLVFDLSRSIFSEGVAPRLGLGQLKFADFEVKSLPGGFREHEAAIDRALKDGRVPHLFEARFTSANIVLRNEGRTMIQEAEEQLAKKSHLGHSRNIFLIAHPFDYPIVEMYDAPCMAHLLEPLSGINGIQSIWVLGAPTHLVVWSTEHHAWTNLISGGTTPGDIAPDHDQDLDLLQQIELEFLEQTNSAKGSPYVFGLSDTGQETDDS
jgi:hypothetical protein